MGTVLVLGASAVLQGMGIAQFIENEMVGDSIGEMKVISSTEYHTVIKGIICHLKLTFHAERPPPQVVPYELLMTAEGKEAILKGFQG